MLLEHLDLTDAFRYSLPRAEQLPVWVVCWVGITLLSWQVVLDYACRSRAFLRVWQLEYLLYTNSTEAATHYNMLISENRKTEFGDAWRTVCGKDAIIKDNWQRIIQAVIERRQGGAASRSTVCNAAKHPKGRRTEFSGVVRFREILVIPLASGALITFNGQEKILAEAVVANVARDYSIQATYENINGGRENPWDCRLLEIAIRPIFRVRKHKLRPERGG